MTDQTSFPKPGTMAETLALVDSVAEATALAPIETLNSQEQRNALVAAYEDPSVIHEGRPDSPAAQDSFLVRSGFATPIPTPAGDELHLKILTDLGIEWARRALRARAIQRDLAEPMRIVARWTTDPDALDELYNRTRGNETDRLPEYTGHA